MKHPTVWNAQVGILFAVGMPTTQRKQQARAIAVDMSVM